MGRSNNVSTPSQPMPNMCTDGTDGAGCLRSGSTAAQASTNHEVQTGLCVSPHAANPVQQLNLWSFAAAKAREFLEREVAIPDSAESKRKAHQSMLALPEPCLTSNSKPM
jgi:hypothetical protein